MNDPLVVERRLFGRIEWFLILAAVLLAGVLAPLATLCCREGLRSDPRPMW
jgi:hypothetical protein